MIIYKLFYSVARHCILKNIKMKTVFLIHLTIFIPYSKMLVFLIIKYPVFPCNTHPNPNPCVFFFPYMFPRINKTKCIYVSEQTFLTNKKNIILKLEQTLIKR